MTIRQLIIAGMNWLVRHPKVVIGLGPAPLIPPTRSHIRTAYNSTNSVTTFDADLRGYIRTNDSTYASMSDQDLQDLINETVTEDEDLSVDFIDPSEPGN